MGKYSGEGHISPAAFSRMTCSIDNASLSDNMLITMFIIIITAERRMDLKTAAGPAEE
jgi:hypothetical protein